MIERSGRRRAWQRVALVGAVGVWMVWAASGCTSAVEAARADDEAKAVVLPDTPRVPRTNPNQGGGDGEDSDGKARTTESTSYTTASGLVIVSLAPGQGREARPGDTVQVHYRGWLLDGTQFDASYDRGEPLEFPLGRGAVIRGWDEGVTGMRVGEERELIIPPELGYGARGAGEAIPPNATLRFRVKLVGVQ